MPRISATASYEHGSVPRLSGTFSHQALVYRDEAEYVAATVPFIEAGLAAGEPVLVAVPSPRLELLRRRVTPDDELLRMVSMEEMGRNPAWIIPAWNDFVAPHAAAGRTARGIGEPIWPGRSDDELVECTRHEALLNLAFAGADGFTLLCPYDAASLPADVLDAAARNHPHVTHQGATEPSARYEGRIPTQLDAPLPPVPPHATTVDFDASTLADVRQRAGDLAVAVGLPERRIDELLLAVSEVTTNSVRHAGGRGRIALWHEPGRFLCEVRDRGRITDPLTGRVRPGIADIGGRGMWLMHQVCDLVQIRTRPDGQAIRLHMAV